MTVGVMYSDVLEMFENKAIANYCTWESLIKKRKNVFTSVYLTLFTNIED